MRPLRIAVISTALATVLSFPATAVAQDPPMADTTGTAPTMEAPVAAPPETQPTVVAQAPAPSMYTPALPLSPLQKITYSAAKVLYRGPFLRGPHMKLQVSRESPALRPTRLFLDCNNVPLLFPGRAQADAVVLYGRKNIAFSSCLTPDQYRYVAHPSRAHSKFYFRLKVKTMMRICRWVDRAAKRGQKPSEYVRVPCKRVRTVVVDHFSARIYYYGKGRSRKDLKAVTLHYNGILVRTQRDGFKKPNFNRRLDLA